ncbi:HAMP domain-containing protein [Phragmitibacter flavus]|uniref:HAMP domain-containing protein n=1 Tax=Phragmitibacter flavus TaxID=2576071 RepID=A0A5R8KIE8_9BACT|nr:adenylate/guanylate cyclase domain-containing protein [Phragmitibacter flavus]TLD72093.1 HAMP domain-containing protein [Phragmitibacter flavus]
MKSSIAAKIFGLALVLVTIMMALVTFLLVQASSITQTLRDFRQTYQPLQDALVNLNEAGLRQRIAFERSFAALSADEGRDAALTEATVDFEKFTAQIDVHLGETKRILDLVGIDSRFIQSFERIRAQTEGIATAHSIVNTRQQEVLEMARRGEATQAEPLLVLLDDIQVALQNRRDEVQQGVHAIIDMAAAHAAGQHKRMLWLSIAATLVSVALGLSLAALITSRLVRPVRSLVTGIGQVQGGDLTVQLAVQSRDEVGAVTQAFNYFVGELRLKEEMRSTFGKYVDPRILARIISSPALKDSGAERQEMTISFSDLVGFTDIGEHLTATNLVNLINRHFTLQAAAIQGHDGVIDKFIGDAVMAFWGPPFTQAADSALLACRAALDEISAIGTLAKELPDLTGLRRNPPRVNIRIGISTGEVVVGNIGSENTRSYTVMGDAVNVASRLEHLNQLYGTRILLCETTRERAGDAIMVREIDAVVVKGKTEPTRLFELLGLPGEDGSSALRELVENFSTALSAFRQREWTSAETAFQHCLTLRPDDAPSQLFLKRIATFRENPPAADWDGSSHMLTK